MSACQECGKMVRPGEFHNYACCVQYRIDKGLPLSDTHKRYLMWLGEQHLAEAATPTSETTDD